MRTLTVRRVVTGPSGTAGLIVHDNFPFAVTLEPEWLDNRAAANDQQGSCIPAGTYICKRINSPTYGNTFEITGVEGRTHVLFHWGNYEDNSDACVLLGEKFEPINGKLAIQQSKIAFNQFLDLMKDEDEFRLIVVDDWKTDIN